MDSEGKEDDSKDFGKVIDVLHNKAKLSSLRTYQGDVAEFMKEKNESTISIAIKEKERQEENEREEKKESFIPPIQEPAQKPAARGGNFKTNFVALSLSIILLMSGALASFYVIEFINRPPSSPASVSVDIVPYNNIITLTNVSGKNLGLELQKFFPADGVSIVKISDANGRLLDKGQDFFNFLELPANMAIRRMLENDFVVGILSQNNEKSYFVVIKVNDFGGAFAAMLDWEKTMETDLSFLNTATSTEVFVWKDLIIKNKDTRGLVNEKNKSKIAYTFLDKNTILITDNLSAIGEISSIYASRPVAR